MNNNKKVLVPASPLSNGIAYLSGSSVFFDTIFDTNMRNEPPVLKNFNGDTSKRWYIDYYESGTRKRKWIKDKPIGTKPQRANFELEKITKFFRSNIDCNLFEVLEKMPLKKKSISTYKTDIKILLTQYPDLKKVDVLEFKDFLIKNYHSNTVRNKIKNLKSVFNFAKEYKFIDYNPFADLKSIPKVEDSDYNYPFTEYERSLIEPELLKVPELYLYTRFIYYSFSRVSELQSLRIKDIDLKSRTIRFQSENVKSKRKIVKPIVKPFLDLLLSSGILNNPSNFYIFGKNLKPDFKKCQGNLPTNMHRQILKDLGLYRSNETVLYGWKHTGNINAYLKGMDIKLIQKMNGHSSLETTEIYLRKLGLFLDKQAFDFDF